MPSAILT